MPINTEKKIIYVHIPKTAGTYIEKTFNIHNNNLLWINKDDLVLGRTLQHYPIDFIHNVINTYNMMNLKNDYININDYYIFTTVRNPYYRFISAYNQYPYKCNNKFKELINGMNIIDFAKHLKNKIDNEGYDFFNYGAYHQFQPMVSYIKTKYNYNIDIIKMDNNDFNDKILKMCKKYNLKFINNKINNNTTKKINTDTYINNTEFINLINFIYKDDFEYFNYSKL